MEIALKPEHEQMLHRWVDSGRYPSMSEAVGAALEARLREEAEIEWLRREVQKGADQLDRGEGITLRTEEDVEAFVEDIARRGAKKLGIQAP